MAGKEDIARARERHKGRVVEDLIVAGWEGVEALEHDGHLLFPEQIRRVRAGGKVEAVDVLVRVPREPDFRRARVEVRKRAAEEGLDWEEDRDYIDNMESICLLALITYDPKNPGDPFDPFWDSWEKFYETTSLLSLVMRIKELQRLVDPAPSEISEPEMLALIASIVKERDIAPLLDYGPAARSFFIISMAVALQTAQELKSYLESSGPSTQE